MNFWDSSAVIEAHDSTSPVRERFSNLLRQKTVHAASRLILPEVFGALARRTRGNTAQAGLVLGAAEDVFARFALYTVSDELIAAAVALCRTERLKGADSVHLAAALSISRDVGRRGFLFVTLDKDQAAAARHRGLRVLPT